MKLTDEELLKHLESAKTTEEVTLDDVYNFIIYYDLKPGTQLVRPHSIYKLYKLWSKKPISSRAFQRRMLNYFTRDKNSYLLNLEYLKISKEVLKQIEAPAYRKTKIVLYQNYFERYVQKYFLTEGPNYVNVNTLYKLYKKWIIQTNKRANNLSFKVFTKFCSIYFPSKANQKKNYLWYGIDFKKMSRELQQQIIEIDNENKQEIPREVPSAEDRPEPKD